MKRFWIYLLSLLLIAALTATGAMAEMIEYTDAPLPESVEDAALPACDEALPDELDCELAAPPAEDEAGPEDEAPQVMPAAPGFEIDENGVVTSYYGEDKDVSVPYGVTAIGKDAFNSCSHVTSVTLPDTVTEIGERAFAWCSAMTRIQLPSSLRSIGPGAFRRSGLTSITLPEGVTDVSEEAFNFCGDLQKVVLPGTVTSIGADAFTYCRSLVEINLPKGLTSIGEGAFDNCALKSVSLPEGVTSIARATFYQCYALERVDIPGSVTAIDNEAFAECYSLTIRGKSGSYAQKWAKSKKIPFVADLGVPSGVKISQGKKATLYMGNTLSLTAVLQPESASSKLTWKSSDTKVATVKNGVVTPKKAGKADITVTTANKKSAKITITVVDAKSVKIKQGKKATLKLKDKQLKLEATVSPGKVNTKLTWKSSNKKVATVSKDGVVTAKKKGKATITVTTKNGKKASIDITVK